MIILRSQYTSDYPQTSTCSPSLCAPGNIYFYLSDDEDIGENDTPIGNESVPSLGGGKTHSLSMFTDIIPVGVFYYGACIGNICSKGVRMEIKEGRLGTGQGVLSFLSLSVNNTTPFLNDNIQLTTTVQCNNGTCPNNTITFHQSNDSVIQSNENILGNQPLPQLNHGDSSLYTINITVNQSGTTFYGACIQNQCSNPVQVATQGILSFLSLSVNNTTPSLNGQYPTLRHRPMQ